MALPSSGAISLNQMHIEAGGTTGTTASLNDSDIRGLIGKASGVAMSFSEWYGASAGWSPTMTVGVYQFKSNPPVYGYGNALSYGSLTDTTVDNLNGRFCSLLNWNSSNNSLVLWVEASSDPGNSGFTTLSINGSNFSRTSATYSFASGSYQQWYWSGATNPFGTTAGATRSIAMT